jgi:hypothetical protein
VTSFAVMVDGVYRATAGSLFFADNPKTLAETTDGTHFTITQNLFVQRDSDGQEIRKERLGVQPRASRPLVGDWRYRQIPAPSPTNATLTTGAFYSVCPWVLGMGAIAPPVVHSA